MCTARTDLEDALLERFVPVDRQLAHLFPAPGADKYAVRVQLGIYLANRDGRCWVKGCQGRTPTSRHEALIRQGHVQGWALPRRIVVFNPINCIALCVDHHNTASEPKANDVADWMLDYYGPDVVRWLRSLKFKTRHPMQGWIDQHS